MNMASWDLCLGEQRDSSVVVAALTQLELAVMAAHSPSHRLAEDKQWLSDAVCSSCCEHYRNVVDSVLLRFLLEEREEGGHSFSSHNFAAAIACHAQVSNPPWRGLLRCLFQCRSEAPKAFHYLISAVDAGVAEQLCEKEDMEEGTDVAFTELRAAIGVSVLQFIAKYYLCLGSSNKLTCLFDGATSEIVLMMVAMLQQIVTDTTSPSSVLAVAVLNSLKADPLIAELMVLHVRYQWTIINELLKKESGATFPFLSPLIDSLAFFQRAVLSFTPSKDVKGIVTGVVAPLLVALLSRCQFSDGKVSDAIGFLETLAKGRMLFPQQQQQKGKKKKEGEQEEAPEKNRDALCLSGSAVAKTVLIPLIMSKEEKGLQKKQRKTKSVSISRSTLGALAEQLQTTVFDTHQLGAAFKAATRFSSVPGTSMEPYCFDGKTEQYLPNFSSATWPVAFRLQLVLLAVCGFPSSTEQWVEEHVKAAVCPSPTGVLSNDALLSLASVVARYCPRFQGVVCKVIVKLVEYGFPGYPVAAVGSLIHPMSASTTGAACGEMVRLYDAMVHSAIFGSPKIFTLLPSLYEVLPLRLRLSMCLRCFVSSCEEKEGDGVEGETFLGVAKAIFASLCKVSVIEDAEPISSLGTTSSSQTFAAVPLPLPPHGMERQFMKLLLLPEMEKCVGSKKLWMAALTLARAERTSLAENDLLIGVIVSSDKEKKTERKEQKKRATSSAPSVSEEVVVLQCQFIDTTLLQSTPRCEVARWLCNRNSTLVEALAATKPLAQLLQHPVSDGETAWWHNVEEVLAAGAVIDRLLSSGVPQQQREVATEAVEAWVHKLFSFAAQHEDVQLPPAFLRPKITSFVGSSLSALKATDLLRSSSSSACLSELLFSILFDLLALCGPAGIADSISGLLSACRNSLFPPPAEAIVLLSILLRSDSGCSKALSAAKCASLLPTVVGPKRKAERNAVGGRVDTTLEQFDNGKVWTRVATILQKYYPQPEFCARSIVEEAVASLREHVYGPNANDFDEEAFLAEEAERARRKAAEEERAREELLASLAREAERRRRNEAAKEERLHQEMAAQREREEQREKEAQRERELAEEAARLKAQQLYKEQSKREAQEAAAKAAKDERQKKFAVVQNIAMLEGALVKELYQLNLTNTFVVETMNALRRFILRVPQLQSVPNTMNLSLEQVAKLKSAIQEAYFRRDEKQNEIDENKKGLLEAVDAVPTKQMVLEFIASGGATMREPPTIDFGFERDPPASYSIKKKGDGIVVFQDDDQFNFWGADDAEVGGAENVEERDATRRKEEAEARREAAWWAARSFHERLAVILDVLDFRENTNPNFNFSETSQETSQERAMVPLEALRQLVPSTSLRRRHLITDSQLQIPLHEDAMVSGEVPSSLTTLLDALIQRNVLHMQREGGEEYFDLTPLGMAYHGSYTTESSRRRSFQAKREAAHGELKRRLALVETRRKEQRERRRAARTAAAAKKEEERQRKLLLQQQRKHPSSLVVATTDRKGKVDESEESSDTEDSEEEDTNVEQQIVSEIVSGISSQLQRGSDDDGEEQNGEDEEAAELKGVKKKQQQQQPVIHGEMNPDDLWITMGLDQVMSDYNRKRHAENVERKLSTANKKKKKPKPKKISEQVQDDDIDKDAEEEASSMKKRRKATEQTPATATISEKEIALRFQRKNQQINFAALVSWKKLKEYLIVGIIIAASALMIAELISTILKR